MQLDDLLPYTTPALSGLRGLKLRQSQDFAYTECPVLSAAFTGALQKLTYLALIGCETHVMQSMAPIEKLTLPATLPEIQTLQVLELDGEGP